MKGSLLWVVLVGVWCEVHALGATSAHVFGHWPTEPRGKAYGVHLDENLAYLQTSTGVRIYDITSSPQPRLIRMIGDEATRVVSAGRYACVFRPDTLRIMDMQDPVAPVQLWFTNTIQADVTLRWPFVYVADAFNGMVTYDFTDPKNPRMGGVVPGLWNTLRADGDVLAATASDAVVFFDIKDRAHPVERSRVAVTAQPFADVDGSYAYVAWTNRLHIFNITNVANPVLHGAYTQPGQFVGVEAGRNVALVSVRGAAAAVIDVRNPDAPRKTGEVGDGAVAFSHSDMRWGVASFEKLELYHESFDSGFLSLETTLDLGGHMGLVRLFGNYAVVRDNDNPTRILDISQRGTPVVINDRLPASYQIEVKGQYLYLVDTAMVLKTYDVSNPRKPRLRSELPIGGYPSTMIVEGDRLYANVTPEFITINVADPDQPRIENRLPLAISGLHMTAAAGLVYVQTHDPDFTCRVYIYDISDPAAPQQTLVLELGLLVGGIQAIGRTLYVSDSTKVYVYDMSTPAAPVAKEPLMVPWVDAISYDGGHQLALLRFSDVQVVDISSRFEPKVTAEYDMQLDNKRDIAFKGNNVYIAAGDYGFIAMQVTGEVPILPALEIFREGETHRVRWPADYPGFILQGASSPNGPWTTVPTGLGATRLFYEAVVPGRAKRFYRLAPAP